jgi:peptidyl-prolyl cis-trans isomerase D
MLNILRKRAQSIVIQAIVLVIAIVFIFWGVGTNLGNKRNVMATVNGEEISVTEYQRAYDNTVDNYRAQFGGTIPQGFLDSIGLQRQVLNQLIQAVIIRQSGREMGVTVSEMETREQIQDMEVFRTNDSFDLELYKEVLSQNRMTPATFEAGLRSDLLTVKVSEAVQDFAMVPQREVEARIAMENEKIRLAYHEVFSDEFLEEVEVHDDELAAWYEENRNRYLTEPKIMLRYLFFGFDEDLEEIEISEDALRTRYESSRDQYVVPEQRRARHILFSVQESDTVETRAEKKAKAEEVLELARQGRDFAELAREYSEGPSGPAGGDLGFFGRGAMVGPFDETVFQLAPGEISEVVETRFGYHIIRLEEIREGKTLAFEEVRDEIAAEVKVQDVKGYTFKRASSAYEDIILSGSLDKYSEQHAEAVRETEYFSRNDPPEQLSYPKLLQAAFSLKEGELSSLVETEDGYAILFLDDVQEPEVPELATVRDVVVDDYVAARSTEYAGARAEEILRQAREEKSLAGAVPEQQEPAKTDYIRRSDMGAASGLPAAVVRDGFELSLRNPFPEEPYVEGDVFIVYELLARKSAEQAMEEAERRQFEEQLLLAYRNTLQQAWIDSMLNRADIWVNEQLLR